MKNVLLVTGAVASLLLAGCASTSGSAVRSGFLSDYSKLQPTTGQAGSESYVNHAIDIRTTNRLYFDPVQVIVANDGAYKDVDRATINRIADTFRQALVKEATQGGYQVVSATGPDVLRIRTAITGLQPASTDLGVTDFIPVKALFNAGRAAAGYAPRTAEMSAEMEILDGGGQQIGMAVVTRKSDDDLAQGHAITWNDLTPIVNTWAKNFRIKLDELRKTSGAR